MKRPDIIDLVILFAITFIGVVFLLFFNLKHSMTFVNLDELLWMYRSRFFIDGILNFEFSNLIQSSQPGIMVMWAVGPFMKIVNYDFHLIVSFIDNLNDSGVGYNIINARDEVLYNNYKSLSFLLNIPIFSIIFFFICFLYYLLKKLQFNKWAIIFFMLLIVTTPYYIYFTTPTDKLVGIFSVLSLLSLLVYASGKGNRKFFIFSAVLGSWAVLTKMSALFLIPFVLFILIFYKLDFVAYFRKNISLLCLCGDMKSIIKNYLIWIVIFFINSIIFLPTIISNPQFVMSLIVKEGSMRTVVDNHNILIGLDIILTYLSDSFLLSFNLFVIIIFFAFLVLIIWRIKNKIKVNKEVLVLVVYFFSFFVYVVLFSKIYSFRYLVPILIVFQIIAGVGIYEFSNIFIRKNNIEEKRMIYLWSVAFILISQGLLIYYSEIEKIEELPYFG
ncbi:MAG: hypothetical protein P1P85_02555 [Patescibacteria group bacterium]|nr:hypothetical protein [Patescibacteria group bacterium]